MPEKNLKIVKYPSNLLRKKTREVRVEEVKDPKISRLIFDMKKTLDAEKGIGLAAPQVGSDLRICIVKEDREEDSNAIALINPKIKSYSRRKVVFEEGCLSFPGEFFPIERPAKVKVAAKDIEGKKIKIKADGLLARVLQHEIDHLDGILLIDRVEKK